MFRWEAVIGGTKEVTKIAEDQDLQVKGGLNPLVEVHQGVAMKTWHQVLNFHILHLFQCPSWDPMEVLLVISHQVLVDFILKVIK